MAHESRLKADLKVRSHVPMGHLKAAPTTDVPTTAAAYAAACAVAGVFVAAEERVVEGDPPAEAHAAAYAA